MKSELLEEIKREVNKYSRRGSFCFPSDIDDFIFMAQEIGFPIEDWYGAYAEQEREKIIDDYTWISTKMKKGMGSMGKNYSPKYDLVVGPSGVGKTYFANELYGDKNKDTIFIRDEFILKKMKCSLQFLSQQERDNKKLKYNKLCNAVNFIASLLIAEAVLSNINIIHDTSSKLACFDNRTKFLNVLGRTHIVNIHMLTASVDDRIAAINYRKETSEHAKKQNIKYGTYYYSGGNEHFQKKEGSCFTRFIHFFYKCFDNREEKGPLINDGEEGCSQKSNSMNFVEMKTKEQHDEDITEEVQKEGRIFSAEIATGDYFSVPSGCSKPKNKEVFFHMHNTDNWYKGEKSNLIKLACYKPGRGGLELYCNKAILAFVKQIISDSADEETKNDIIAIFKKKGLEINLDMCKEKHSVNDFYQKSSFFYSPKPVL